MLLKFIFLALLYATCLINAESTTNNKTTTPPKQTAADCDKNTEEFKLYRCETVCGGKPKICKKGGNCMCKINLFRNEKNQKCVAEIHCPGQISSMLLNPTKLTTYIFVTYIKPHLPSSMKMLLEFPIRMKQMYSMGKKFGII